MRDAKGRRALTDRARIGQAAEQVVAEWLERRGYQIVARNLRIGRLELDVVARRGGLIAVVEVRARGPASWTSGFASLDRAKRRRIRRAGERLWQRRYRQDPTVSRLRFDAASVTFREHGADVEYAPGAF